MSRFFPRLWGNRENADRIGQAIVNNTLSHAYIIEGAEGCGKTFFARQIAAALACDHRLSPEKPLPCGTCVHCKRILGTGSPDVRLIAPTGASLSVDAIREARADMYLSSTEEAHKVYIIDRAHTMTPQAQNALLIVLEEPPTHSVILLLTDRADALLPTIRSRAQHLRMRLLTPAEMDEALSNDIRAQALKRTSPEEFSAILEGAGGCLGRVLPRLDDKARTAMMRDRATVERVTEALLSKGGYAQSHKAEDLLPQKRAELIEALEGVAVAVRDLILLTRDGDAPLLFYTDRARAQALAEATGLAALLTVFDRIGRTCDALSKNANVSLSLLSLFTENN